MRRSRSALHAVRPFQPLAIARLTPNFVGRKWFDCAECHQESEDHELMQKLELIFACKKCKKCFRKDAQEFEERLDGHHTRLTDLLANRRH
jgi:hypothetical protein